MKKDLVLKNVTRTYQLQFITIIFNFEVLMLFCKTLFLIHCICRVHFQHRSTNTWFYFPGWHCDYTHSS